MRARVAEKDQQWREETKKNAAATAADAVSDVNRDGQLNYQLQQTVQLMRML